MNGDPSSVLIEILDPEFNNKFTDVYMDVKSLVHMHSQYASNYLTALVRPHGNHSNVGVYIL